MFNMTEKTKAFLQKNAPDVLEQKDIRSALMVLYRIIDEKGFSPPQYLSYNDFGREAQNAYDDLYENN